MADDPSECYVETNHIDVNSWIQEVGQSSPFEPQPSPLTEDQNSTTTPTTPDSRLAFETAALDSHVGSQDHTGRTSWDGSDSNARETVLTNKTSKGDSLPAGHLRDLRGPRGNAYDEKGQKYVLQRFGPPMPPSQLGNSLQMYKHMVSALPIALQYQINKLPMNADLLTHFYILRVPELILAQDSPTGFSSLSSTSCRESSQRAGDLVALHLSSLYGDKWSYAFLENLIFRAKDGTRLKTIPGLGVVAKQTEQALDFKYMTPEIKELETKQRQQERQRAFKNALGRLRHFEKSPGKKGAEHARLLMKSRPSVIESTSLKTNCEPKEQDDSSSGLLAAPRYPRPPVPSLQHLDIQKQIRRSQKRQSIQKLDAIAERSEPASVHNSVPNTASFNVIQSQDPVLHKRGTENSPVGAKGHLHHVANTTSFSDALTAALQNLTEPQDEDTEGKIDDQQSTRPPPLEFLGKLGSLPNPAAVSGEETTAKIHKTGSLQSKLEQTLPKASASNTTTPKNLHGRSKSWAEVAASPTPSSPSKNAKCKAEQADNNQQTQTAGPLTDHALPAQDKTTPQTTPQKTCKEHLQGGTSQIPTPGTDNAIKHLASPKTSVHIMTPYSVYPSPNCRASPSPKVVIPLNLFRRMRAPPSPKRLHHLGNVVDEMNEYVCQPVTEPSESRDSPDGSNTGTFTTFDTETSDE